jgi:hypothetical protein
MRQNPIKRSVAVTTDVDDFIRSFQAPVISSSVPRILTD